MSVERCEEVCEYEIRSKFALELNVTRSLIVDDMIASGTVVKSRFRARKSLNGGGVLMSVKKKIDVCVNACIKRRVEYYILITPGKVDQAFTSLDVRRYA